MISKSARILRTTLTALTCLLCLCALTFGQKTDAEKGDQKPPLRFRVVIEEPSVCTMSQIKLEVEVQNIATRPILMDPKGMIYQINVDRDGGGVAVTNDPGGIRHTEQLVTLLPRESYVRAVTYRLDDALFNSPGIYRFQLTYGQFAPAGSGPQDLFRGTVKSNAILFELRDCQDARGRVARR